MTLYETGEIDITGVGLSNIERVLDPRNLLNDELYISPDFSLFYIGFNCAEEPFDDVNIRRAFSYAIDKDKIVELVLKSVVRRADGILPPGMPGYTQYIKGLNYDVDKAKRLIRESKYGNVTNLPPIELTASGWGDASDVEKALVDMWRRNLDVEVAINLWQPEMYSYIIRDEKDDLFTLGWAADYPDPQNFLDVLFHTGGMDNTGEYSNPQVDNWLNQAAVENDSTARFLQYRLAEQKIIDDAAIIPLYFNVSYTVVKPYVKDYPSCPLWIPRLRYVSIEPD
jgi:oligopeptide transport system substrate-binding protein